MIDNHSVRITMPLISQFAKLNIGVVLCKQIWKQIVEAKIKNQSLLLEKMGNTMTWSFSDSIDDVAGGLLQT